MALEFTVSASIPASSVSVYEAWLDSAQHSAMTGGEARVSAQVGAEFTAWDGYIQGRNLELQAGKKIVQAWRSTEFAPGDPDSRLEVNFESVGEETRLTIFHSNLPSHGMQYQQGWVEAYFEPMQAYFNEQGREAPG